MGYGNHEKQTSFLYIPGIIAVIITSVASATVTNIFRKKKLPLFKSSKKNSDLFSKMA